MTEGGSVYRIDVGEREAQRQRKSWMECRGTTPERLLELERMEGGGVRGIPCVAGKVVDYERNTGGEGGLLDWN